MLLFYFVKLNLRIAIGNGLRPDVWMKFKKRFGIKRIGEFYAATEGASALLNIADVDFSIGYMSPLASKVIPSTLVKYNVEKDELVRDSKVRRKGDRERESV